VSGHSQEILDLMTYITVCAPDFPSEDETDTRTEFTRLSNLLREVLRRAKSGQKRWWLEISIREAEQALAAYESGDEEKGRWLLSSAEDYFENYLKGKRLKSTFVAGSDGIEKKP